MFREQRQTVYLGKGAAYRRPSSLKDQNVRPCGADIIYSSYNKPWTCSGYAEFVTCPRKLCQIWSVLRWG